MKIEMTPEEHARLHRRRARQALGLLVAVLVLVEWLALELLELASRSLNSRRRG